MNITGLPKLYFAIYFNKIVSTFIYLDEIVSRSYSRNILSNYKTNYVI